MTNKPNNQSAQEVDVEKLAFDYAYQWRDGDVNIQDARQGGFEDGFRECQALQSKAVRYSLEDMIRAFMVGKNSIHIERDGSCWEDETAKNKFIQSLTPTHTEVKGEAEQGRIGISGIKIP